VRLDPKTQHCDRSISAWAGSAADRQFDIVHASAASIDPDPDPQVAFPGWKLRLDAGGVTRGAEVDDRWRRLRSSTPRGCGG
jgi:hypothetical protein